MEKAKKEEKQSSKTEVKGIKTTPYQTTLIVGLLISTAAFGGWVIGANYVSTNVNANANTVKAINSKSSNSNCDCGEGTNTNSNTNTNNNETIKELDLTKSLNTNGITYYDAKELSNGNTDLGLSVKVNGGYAKLNINWVEFGPHSGASAWGDTTVEYEIRNLSGTVKEGYVGEVGQSAVGTTLYYLMDDGTVEYTKVFSNKTDNAGNSYYSMNYTYDKDNDGRISGEHFEGQGKVNGVKDVVKLYVVNARGGMSGYVTTIGATRDGSFYDLGSAINK